MRPNHPFPRAGASVRRRRGLFGAALTLALAQGCVSILYDDHCGSYFRVASTAAPVRDASGAAIASALVTVAEVRGDTVPGTLRLNVFSGTAGVATPLQGHVQSAALVDAEGRLVIDLPLDPLGPSAAAASTVALHDAAQVDDLRRRIAEGRLVLDLATDLPGLTTIHVLLVPEYVDPDFRQARCS